MQTNTTAQIIISSIDLFNLDNVGAHEHLIKCSKELDYLKMKDAKVVHDWIDDHIQDYIFPSVDWKMKRAKNGGTQ